MTIPLAFDLYDVLFTASSSNSLHTSAKRADQKKTGPLPLVNFSRSLYRLIQLFANTFATVFAEISFKGIASIHRVEQSTNVRRYLKLSMIDKITTFM